MTSSMPTQKKVKKVGKGKKPSIQMSTRQLEMAASPILPTNQDKRKQLFKNPCSQCITPPPPPTPTIHKADSSSSTQPKTPGRSDPPTSAAATGAAGVAPPATAGSSVQRNRRGGVSLMDFVETLDSIVEGLEAIVDNLCETYARSQERRNVLRMLEDDD